jgi:hypothetical protein
MYMLEIGLDFPDPQHMDRGLYIVTHFGIQHSLLEYGIN